MVWIGILRHTSGLRPAARVELEALDKFLVVRSSSTLAIPDALHRMLHLEQVLDVAGGHLG